MLKSVKLMVDTMPFEFQGKTCYTLFLTALWEDGCMSAIPIAQTVRPHENLLVAATNLAAMADGIADMLRKLGHSVDWDTAVDNIGRQIRMHIEADLEASKKSV